jgi:hypothetical protein
MALGCSGAFSNMMTWIVNNQAADQGGVFTTNIKAVIGVGDCTHLTSSGEFAHGATAYGILESRHPRFHIYFTPTSSSWLNISQCGQQDGSEAGN